MSLSSCHYSDDRSFRVENMASRWVATPEEARRILKAGERFVIPVLGDPEMETLEYFKPDILVDAIIAKKNLGISPGLADIVIALGPGFTAPADCDLVVETMRGHNLGRLIFDGAALPNTGVPGLIQGEGKRRVTHAPATGTLTVVGHRLLRHRGRGHRPCRQHARARDVERRGPRHVAAGLRGLEGTQDGRHRPAGGGRRLLELDLRQSPQPRRRRGHGDSGADGKGTGMTYRDIIESIRRDGDVTVATYLEGERRGEKIRLASSDEAPENCFVESLSEPFRLFILGAGHVGGSLAMLAQHLEFNVWLCDPRPEILHEREYRDNVTLVEADYGTVFRDMDLRATDFLVILTPGHKKTRTASNSRCKSARLPQDDREPEQGAAGQEKLMSRGVAKALDTVYAPVGLDIRPQTPYEIAVSILAEMIEVYRAGTRDHQKRTWRTRSLTRRSRSPSARSSTSAARDRAASAPMLVNGKGERVAGTRRRSRRGGRSGGRRGLPPKPEAARARALRALEQRRFGPRHGLRRQRDDSVRKTLNTKVVPGTALCNNQNRIGSKTRETGGRPHDIRKSSTKEFSRHRGFHHQGDDAGARRVEVRAAPR